MKIAMPILAAVVSHAVRADDLTWDVAAGDGPTITYDSGTWILTVANTVWNTGSGNVGWSNDPVKNALIPGAASGASWITSLFSVHVIGN